MQVILVKPVRKLGKVGNTVTVADGFGRNYLIPQEFAIRATKENIAKFASLQKGMEAMDGPINFGERDRWWGLITEGFTPPLYCMNYNPPYYIALFENYGF